MSKIFLTTIALIGCSQAVDVLSMGFNFVDIIPANPYFSMKAVMKADTKYSTTYKGSPASTGVKSKENYGLRVWSYL